MAKISNKLCNKRGHINRKKNQQRRSSASEEVASADKLAGAADVKLNLASLLASVDQNKLRTLLAACK